MLTKATATPTKPPPPKASHRGSPRRRGGRPPLWRNPIVLVTLTVVVVVVAVIAALGNAHKSSPSTPSTSATSQIKDQRILLDAVTKLDPKVVAAVGDGGLPQRFTTLGGAPPLAGADGKPEVFYVGADYCPYCAAQRWSMVVALSRFGSFGHLYLTKSAVTDVYPLTATFTFHGSDYTSRYIDFVAVETADSNGTPLQTLSPDQAGVFGKYSVPPYVPANAAGGIPWLDIGNRYLMVSSGFSPAVLAGLSWAQIAEKLSNANDPVTKGIVGNANTITAAICKSTGMQPADVCNAAPIAGLVSTLP